MFVGQPGDSKPGFELCYQFNHHIYLYLKGQVGTTPAHQFMEPGISRAETQHRDCVAGRRDSPSLWDGTAGWLSMDLYVEGG